MEPSLHNHTSLCSIGKFKLIECNLRLLTKKIQSAIRKLLFIHNWNIVYFFYLILYAGKIFLKHPQNHVANLFLIDFYIGAAFTEGLSSGLSTSVAVFCHELPHELGKRTI